jgi:hypothetical protein
MDSYVKMNYFDVGKIVQSFDIYLLKGIMMVVMSDVRRRPI